MRIALASQPFMPGDAARNTQMILRTLDAMEDSADLIVFGEFFLQGFHTLTWAPSHDSTLAITQADPLIVSIAKAAKEHRIAVSFGYLEKSGGRFYSSQMVISSDGEIIANYHRVSPWGESEQHAASYHCGQDFDVFNYCGKRLTIVLGSDPWTPDFAGKIEKLQPDAILWPVHRSVNPAAWNAATKFEYALQAGHVRQPMLLVNSIEQGSSRARGGAVFFENGRIRLELAAGEQGFLFANI